MGLIPLMETALTIIGSYLPDVWKIAFSLNPSEYVMTYPLFFILDWAIIDRVILEKIEMEYE